jgi:HD-GYP domain-containing protein (c-di-GMP phosphodiesterase class II)/HAMP domain-containing protein
VVDEEERMKQFKFLKGRTLFSSKVARRIFLLFILCALIPVSVLAYLSFSQVQRSLYAQAEEDLRFATKTSGMATFERLKFLETDLRVIGAVFEAKNGEAGPPVAHRQALVSGFSGIVAMAGDGRIQHLFGSISSLPRFTDDEKAHLRSGKPLVLTRRSHVYLVLPRSGPRALQRLLIGEIIPGFLWNTEELSPLRALIVLDESQNVVFSSFPEYTPMRELRTALRKDPSVGQLRWTHGNEVFLSRYWNLFMVPRFHANWVLVKSERESDILGPVVNFKNVFLPLVLLAFFLAVLLSLIQIRRSLVPIGLLKEATQKIAAKQYESRVSIGTDDEFGELGGSFNVMAESLENHLRNMTILNRIGLALSAEKSNDRLLELILLGGKHITHADGCALFRVTENNELNLSMVHIDSIHRVAGNGENAAIPLYDMNGKPNSRSALAFSAINDVVLNIPDIDQSPDFDFASLREFDKAMGYRTVSLLVVPVKNHEKEILGVLLLFNAQDRLSRIGPFSEDDRRLLEALASQAAVALSKNKLVDDFSELFDSLVELIATAIDKKSPYTGDHCRRVPKLTMMLAQAVCDRKDGIFKNVALSEEEMHELKIAALLHDCGKVTTPVHIADKATRLETIFDRIHLIDTRFEVVKRDERIASQKRQRDLLSLGRLGELSVEKEALENILAQIEEDRDFVRSCNSGEIVMAEERRNRIAEISRKYRWTGPDGREESVLSDDDLYMLTSAVRGTLTSAEREVIKQHVDITISMLESLHYPKALRNVPLYAQAHHERIDGKGYPKGLTRKEIPLQGRIMAIADIFEAMTASNRPYKRALTLSESLRSLGSMKQDGHIDPDLFDLFIDEKIYMRFAEKYLSPEQIDEVVLTEIPGYSPKPGQVNDQRAPTETTPRNS